MFKSIYLKGVRACMCICMHRSICTWSTYEHMCDDQNNKTI